MIERFLTIILKPCSECDNKTMRKDLVKHAHSQRYGVYYKGKGICPRCLNVKYNEKIRESEAQNGTR